MISAVVWGLERAFFFGGILIYWTLYVYEFIQWFIQFKSTIDQIIRIETQNEEYINLSAVFAFVFVWLILAMMAGKKLNSE